MLKVDKEQKTIHITRGDTGAIKVDISSLEGAYTPQVGDVIRFSVYEEDNYENVVLRKNYVVESSSEPIKITLFGEDTKIGEIINEPVTYWYEVELNPEVDPHTIIGYDLEGPKLFILYPEGGQ